MTGNHKLKHDPTKHDYDFTMRKTVHTKLFTETHAGLRVKAAEMKLSVQEIMQELAQRLVDGDNRIMAILKEYKRDKRKKETDSLIGKADVEELYDVIGDNNPFGDDDK